VEPEPRVQPFIFACRIVGHRGAGKCIYYVIALPVYRLGLIIGRFARLIVGGGIARVCWSSQEGSACTSSDSSSVDRDAL
jgi:hypothetical protein